MSRKLKDWVRLDSKNIAVTGSNIRRPKRPASGNWAEIYPYDCCGPEISDGLPADFDTATYTVSLACDTDTPLDVTVTFNVQPSNAGQLIDKLNEYLGFLGYFSTDGTNIILKVKGSISRMFCPADDLVLTITAV